MTRQKAIDYAHKYALCISASPDSKGVQAWVATREIMHTVRGSGKTLEAAVADMLRIELGATRSREYEDLLA